MPSISGLAVVATEYPSGQAGVDTTIAKMVAYIHEGRSNALARQFAEGIVRQAGFAVNSMPTHRQIMQAFLNFLRDNVRYRPDAHMTETVQNPAVTLCVPGAAACIPVGDCFPEGTLLLRDDFNFIPVEKIKAGEKIWGRDKWTTVRAAWSKGVLPVDAIKMNNGSTMYLTAGHKVYVGICEHGRRVCPTCLSRRATFTRIPVSELQPKDVLLQPQMIAFGRCEDDPDRLYVEALALADGWTDVTKPNVFMIAGRDGMRKEAQKHEVKKICERLGIETRWHRRYITVYDAAWAKRIHALGAYARFKRLETINLTEAAAAQALRGVMADSTQNSQGGGRTYSTTSHLLMLQMRVLHRMFGWRLGYSYLTPKQHGGAGKHPMWRLCVPGTLANRALITRKIDRSVRKVPCWDITTEDHYVYLPEHDVTVSNCDDGAAVLGWLATAYGIPVRLLIQHFNTNTDHVLLEFQDDDGSWLAADFSNYNFENNPVGWAPQCESDYRIDPFDSDNLAMAGAREVEFVAVGRIPSRKSLPRVTLGRLPPRRVGATVVPVSTAPFEQAATDLNNQVIAVVTAGDTYANAATPDLAQALSSYKAAGQAGATAVGPEIDLAGAWWVTQPLTHQAWVSNGDLQAITATDAASVGTAKIYITNMVALWQQAINDGTVALLEGKQQPSPGVSGRHVATWAIGFGLVGGLVFAYTRGKKRR